MFLTDAFWPIGEINQQYSDKVYLSPQYKNDRFSNHWQESGNYSITEMAEIAWNYLFYKNKSIPGATLPYRL